METLIDYISGQEVPNIGAEANRQAVERFLVEEKGFAQQQLATDAPIVVQVADDTYASVVDLVVRSLNDVWCMAFRIVAGSLGSREREILAAARLFTDYQIPLAIVTDGKTALVLDTLSGKKIAEGMDAVPSQEEIEARLTSLSLTPFPPERVARERLIFRSYDTMNVNRAIKSNPNVG